MIEQLIEQTIIRFASLGYISLGAKSEDSEKNASLKLMAASIGRPFN